MSLSEKLKTKACKSETVVVDGDEFTVEGKTKRERGALFAKARRKDGSMNVEKLESIMLAACVSDAADGSRATEEEWNEVPSHVTGPLVAKIMSVCGMDKEDMASDPKDLDSTES